MHGKILNNEYMHILYEHPKLNLKTVFLLDRVRKELLLSKESVSHLRNLKSTEERVSSLYLFVSVSKSIEDSI